MGLLGRAGVGASSGAGVMTARGDSHGPYAEGFRRTPWPDFVNLFVEATEKGPRHERP
jgi:hypothetical protein